MRLFFISSLLLLSCKSFATIFQIGTTKPYPSPNNLYLQNIVQDGDTIEIDAETYSGQAALAYWHNNNLLIKGVGGRPSLIANGESIMGKGIWVLGGNNIIVENIEFSGATVPDNNGAGIRLDGDGMKIRSCYFHNNENGILTSNSTLGDVVIEYSEFENNGFGDGLSHNLYIGRINSLTFRFNYSHHANIGHNLKSRAKTNYIVYNRIMDEQTGNSSRLIDIPNGGFTLVMGNSLMQGEQAVNNNLLGYGLEGLSNSDTHELYAINNTFVNKRVASCIFVSIANGTNVANISNNIFAGSGVEINGNTTTLNTNYYNSNISDVSFSDESNYNYRLTSMSPAIDYGTTQSSINGYSLTPDTVYIHPTTYALRSISNDSIDVGAYEFDQEISINEQEIISTSVYPIPTKDIINISLGETSIAELYIYNTQGKVVLKKIHTNNIDLSNLNSGIYFLKIITKNGDVINQSILKE